jgi:phage terminase large subunit-like protein
LKRQRPTRTTQADNAVYRINQLTHTKGPFAGQGFNLRDWQERIIRKLFTERPDGLRQYRTCLLMLPRKNGKTELAAALAIYFLLFDGEIGGEVYSAAADKDQAGLVFGVAAQMIRNEPELDAEQGGCCEIVDSQKRIVHRKTGSFYRAISAEAYSKHGFNASVVIYDELHAAPNRELWDVLSTSQSARAQPLMFAISTAGYDRHSILWELYQHAKRVEENPSLDPTFLPLLFEAPEGADWTDEAVWKAANPALGDFRSLEEMRAFCARAQEIPEQQNTFRRLYLNQWTDQSTRWVDMAAWDACAGPTDWRTLREVKKGAACLGGLDLSTRDDLTALVLYFSDQSVVPFFWVPAEGARVRGLRDRVPYEQWIQDGLITATPGNVVDQGIIRQDINRIAREYRVQQIGFDDWNASKLSQELQDFDGLQVVKIRQGFGSLSEGTKTLGAYVVGRTLRHGGHPVLRWMASNAVTKSGPNETVMFDKEKARERIDGLSALTMAITVSFSYRADPEQEYTIAVF